MTELSAPMELSSSTSLTTVRQVLVAADHDPRAAGASASAARLVVAAPEVFAGLGGAARKELSDLAYTAFNSALSQPGGDDDGVAGLESNAHLRALALTVIEACTASFTDCERAS